MTTSVEEINRIEELVERGAEWNRLLDQTPDASFFHTLQWLAVYWEHFGAGQKLRGLVVRSGGQTTGILPLVVRTERTRVGRVRVLTYPLHDWGSFYGPIGPDPAATLRAGLDHVRHTPRDWDLLELRWIDGRADAGAAERAMRSAGFQACKTVWDTTAAVDLRPGWDAWLAGRSSKWRNNLHRAERRLAACGRIVHFRYRPRGRAHGDDGPRWELYDACERIARRSWQGDSTTGTTLSHDAVRPFVRHVHAVAAEAGALDLNLLLVGHRPLAFAYNYHWRGQVYGLRAGFDAELSRDGAGNLLIARTIEDSCRRGDVLLDLGAGYLDCKRHLFSHVVPIHRVSHFPLGAPRTLVLRVKRWLQQHRRPAVP